MARVLLRLPQELHRALTLDAGAERVSFNELCVRRLRTAPSAAGTHAPLQARVIERAHAVAGPQLAGVIVIGSWARGEAAVTSDIDVLVVVDATVSLTRDLYRAWDRAPLSCEGRTIDAHFARLSDPGTPPTAVWCEAAIDGVIWFDRDGAVARRLAEIRRAIAEGHITRAVVHGQPYWRGAA